MLRTRLRHLVGERNQDEDGVPVGQPRFLLSRDWRGDDHIHPAQVRWRLLSGNNRQLGRSAGVFDDVTAACAAARDLQAGLDACEQIVVRLVAPSRWVWSILLDGTLVAVSGRSYEMERIVNGALDHFLTGVAQAPAPLAESVPQQRVGTATVAALLHLPLPSS